MVKSNLFISIVRFVGKIQLSETRQTTGLQFTLGFLAVFFFLVNLGLKFFRRVLRAKQNPEVNPRFWTF